MTLQKEACGVRHLLTVLMRTRHAAHGSRRLGGGDAYDDAGDDARCQRDWLLPIAVTNRVVSFHRA